MPPPTVEHRLRLRGEAVESLEVRWREIVESLGADFGEIDLVKHGVEQRVVLCHLSGEFVEHCHDLLAVGALDDDDRVVLLAKLLRVVDPELVVVALGIEQVDAAHLVAEVARRPEPGHDRREHRDEHDRAGRSDRQPRPGDHQGREQPASMTLRRVLRRRGLVGRRREGLRVVDLQHGARSGVGGGGMLGDDPHAAKAASPHPHAVAPGRARRFRWLRQPGQTGEPLAVAPRVPVGEMIGAIRRRRPKTLFADGRVAVEGMSGGKSR